MDLEDPQQTKMMALYTLVGFMRSFPSLARKYYHDCDKQLLEILMPYIKQIVSPAILDNEIQKIEVSQVTLKQSGQGEGLTFSLFKSTKEIVAEYTKGEVSMQLKIQIPHDYPLKSVSVEVGQQLKITERQKNKWVLAIKNLL
jgi:E3 ubiquitin-protein ligase listerin